MKKTFKIFLILPLLFISMFFLFACGEDSVRSVSISLPSSSSIVEDKGRYYLEFSSTPLSLNVSLSPSKFSTRNITWITSASNVAYVYNGKLVMIGEGNVDIQATYVNEDGSCVFSSVVKLNISKERLPHFAQPSTTTMYAGRDVKDNFTVQYAKEDVYEYIYYKIGGDGSENGRQVSEIIDAGEYLITYVKKQTQTKYAEMTLTVSKYVIARIANDCSSVFSEALPGGFFTTTPTSQNFRSVGFEIKGIGIDAGKTIGWYLYRTAATTSSTVGTYPTSVEFEFDENYAKNYTFESHSGNHTITPKKVILEVKNQEIIYGMSPLSNLYSLYSKEEFEQNHNSSEGLSALTADRLRLSINPGNYVLSKNSVVIEKNEWGYIDAGTYSLTYNPSLLSTDDNVEVDLDNILSGTLNVERQAFTITPDINNSKVYTEEDNLAALKYSPTLSFPEIKPFLVIDYKTDDLNEPDPDYGENNFCAPAGNYFYDLNNAINKNFNFSLVSEASSGYSGNDPIQFEVKKCRVVVQFNDLVAYYKTPLGYDDNHKPVPTVSYYSLMPNDLTSPNYQLNSFSSMTINGVEQVVDGSLLCIADEFEDNGIFVFSTGETFKIKLKLKEEIAAHSHFATFSVVKDNDTENPQNYEVDVKKSFVHQDKINITVIPLESSERLSKEYSGDGSMPTGTNFYDAYTYEGTLEGTDNINSIFNTNLLLSLTDKDGLFHKKNPDNSFTPLDNMIDCGDYKIFLLSTLRYVPGKEYYNFSLDTSKNYIFSVTKKNIEIIPNDNQRKTYGDSDPILTYSYADFFPNLSVTGSLSRAAGENAGTYKIMLGTLNFGANFKLTLSSAEKNFTILKREITITPISYITTFGDSFPSSIEYYNSLAEQAYDKSILKEEELTFSGGFNLVYDSEIIQKVGGFYPVKIVNEEPVSYIIKKGNFSCSNPNYEMTVIETSTYLVNPKEATINFIAKNKTSDQFDLTITDFSDYTIDSEDGKEDVVLSKISISVTPSPSEDEYFVSSMADIISPPKIYINGINGTDVTDCYTLSLRNKVVYYIETIIVNLAIVSNADPESSLINKTFSGEAYSDLFKIVCLNPEDFEIVSTDHLITYSTTAGKVDNPKDAGSYFVSLEVNDQNKIILKNSNDGEITFSSLGEKKNGCVLNISKYAYLNIARANINFNQANLVFEESLEYGSDETDLSNIKTTYQDGSFVFTGVDGESEVPLKKFNGKNFVFFSSPQLLETLNVSSVAYNIKVTIQPDDPNYSPRLVEVQLIISPKEIELDSLSLEYKGKYQNDEIVYSGLANIFALQVQTSTPGAVYTNSYIYKELETSHENDVHSYVIKYNYNHNSGSSAVSETNEKIPISELTFSTIEGISSGGNSYYLLNKDSSPFCVLVKNQDASPKNAGIYLCIATCTTGENFKFSDGSKTQSHFSFFEIVRASNITIYNWESEFRYGTRFDLSEPSTLPFTYSMDPNFKSRVEYSVSDQADWGEDYNFILPVSSYVIFLTIDEPNYYLSSPQDFSVISCEVDIIFPEREKYGFKGENEPVDLFLEDLVAILKDHNGNLYESKRYKENESDFELTYFVKDSEVPLQSPPWEAGDYTLIVKYGSTSANHYGYKAFNYSIEMQAFTGEIKISNKEIEYNASYSAAILYEQILQMFKIQEEYNDYTLTVKDDAGKVISGNDSQWLESTNKEGVHQIFFIVEFTEDDFKEYKGSASLTITAKKITDSNFIFPNNNEQYSYTGKNIYNHLIFSGIVNLSPKNIGEEVKISVGSADYFVKTLDYNKVKVADNMNRDIFTLTYNYFEESITIPGTFNPINNIPLSSKEVDYKVEYVFSDFGGNYLNRLNSSTITRYFRINKLSTLYISIYDSDSSSFDTDIVREYTGENYWDSLNLVNLIGVSNNALEKDNIKKKMIKVTPNSLSPTYLASEGVHLVVFYTNSGGVLIDNLKNAGDYFLNISFLKVNSYAVSEFFEYVVFNGGTPYKTSDYFTTSSVAFRDENHLSYPFIYQTHFSIPFTIEKGDCPYNAENIDGIMIKSLGEYEVTIETAGLVQTTILYFSSDYTFTLEVGTPFTIVFERYIGGSYITINNNDINFYNGGEYFFSNFDVGMEYSFMFVDPDGNYKNSEHIRFRIDLE